MPAPLGNQNGVKIKSPELRQQAYESYCSHIAKGKVKKSWYFEHPSASLTWETMEKYISQNEVEFDPIKKKVAEAKGLMLWEGKVEEAALGDNKDASIPGLQMVMRNKFGWDKIEHTESASTEEYKGNHNRLMGQITQRQTAQIPQIPS
jgi:hypothetical protein